MTPLEFLKTNQPLAEFLNDEGLRLSNIKSIKEEFVCTKVKGHSDIRSRFKMITLELTEGHTMKIETDLGYSFFRSNLESYKPSFK